MKHQGMRRETNDPTTHQPSCKNKQKSRWVAPTAFAFRSEQPKGCWLDQKVWRRPTANKSLLTELFFTLACW
jgi:hypothetical protein